MKKELSNKTVMFPAPVLLIGTYDEDGKANLMNAAWGGIYDTNEFYICLTETHKTAKNIVKNKAFSVSFAPVEKTIEADYVGIVSGNKVLDKVKKAGFTPIKSQKVNAPLFEELPVSIECSLLSYDEGRIVGKIEGLVADESVLSNGKVDLNKFKPISYDGETFSYWVIGEKVGKAFSDGNKIK